MASKTAATESKRKARDARMGRDRKAALRAKGTTKKPSVLFGDDNTSK